jgi:hypothetical protein
MNDDFASAVDAYGDAAEGRIAAAEAVRAAEVALGRAKLAWARSQRREFWAFQALQDAMPARP